MISSQVLKNRHRHTPLNMSLCDFVAPLNYKYDGGIGSTDVGDVSWVAPTVQARVTTCAVGTPFHTWQTVSQGKLPAAHKGMVHAAKLMASTGIHLLKYPEKLKEVKKIIKEIKRNALFMSYSKRKNRQFK